MGGYREQARRCDACLTEPDADEALKPFAGQQLCSVCLEDYRPALKAWGLEHRADITEHPLHRHVLKTSRVRVVRPTPLEIYAHLRAEGLGDRWRRIFGTTDPETGNPCFDKQVWIEEHGVGVTMALLADEVVQAAVVEALGVAAEVELDRQEVLVTHQVTSSDFDPEQLLAMDQVAVAVAVCVERWARDRVRG